MKQDPDEFIYRLIVIDTRDGLVDGPDWRESSTMVMEGGGDLSLAYPDLYWIVTEVYDYYTIVIDVGVLELRKAATVRGFQVPTIAY